MENRLLTVDFLSDDSDFRKGGDVRADGDLLGVFWVPYDQFIFHTAWKSNEPKAY